MPHERVLSAEPGIGGCPGIGRRAARAEGLWTSLPARSKPEARNSNSAGRSSGLRLVTASGRPSHSWFGRTACSGLNVSGNLADHSGGPATGLHRVPCYPPPPGGGGRTCRDGKRLAGSRRIVQQFPPRKRPALRNPCRGQALARRLFFSKRRPDHGRRTGISGAPAWSPLPGRSFSGPGRPPDARCVLCP